MKLKTSILAFAFFSAVGCVTEPKDGDAPKNFATMTSKESTAARPALTTKKDTLPGHIVVKCRIQGSEVGKLLLCGPSSVKLINEMTKVATEYTFKGDRGAIPLPNDGSYYLEITTKGCSESRKFLGMTNGMGIEAQFGNCAVK